MTEEFVTRARIALASTKIFSEKVNRLGLSKAFDFRHCDLSGSDFTGSDLRGYDFTGSDLRDARGSDIIFDDTTIFIDADLGKSCFAFRVERDSFLNSARGTEHFGRISRLYWTDQIRWADQYLENEGREVVNSTYIADKMLESSNVDTSVKVHILLSIHKAFQKKMNILNIY